MLSFTLQPVFAQQMTAHSPLLKNLGYQIVGLLIVIFALGMLCVATALLGRIATLLSRPAAAEEEVPPAPAAIPETDETVIAAIAAAVAHVIRHPHHIIAVKLDPRVQQAWSSEGRRAIYQSHKIR
jgi:Na+-transporting methylmalonyl-CoA/oxaloacetate decarboxylase gamma subunit